jgi:hypothetical protein
MLRAKTLLSRSISTIPLGRLRWRSLRFPNRIHLLYSRLCVLALPKPVSPLTAWIFMGRSANESTREGRDLEEICRLHLQSSARP